MQLNAETTQARAIKPSAPPPFYERPMLLRPGLNVRSGLTGPKGYEFARGAVAVPIGVSEFPLAARHYPIMFTAAELAPVVVLGVKGGRNLFVEPDGSWRSGHYVPGYIRRYPFTLTTIPDCVEQMLAIDTASDPGRLDSPPTSRRSAPSSASRRACAIAATVEAWRPPS